MNTRGTPASHRNSLLFVPVIVVVVLLIGIASVEVSQVKVSQKSHEGSPNFIGTGSATSNSTKGLSLTLSLNTTTIAVNHGILITVDERNNLPEANNVSAGTGWLVKDLSLSQCGVVNRPYGISLLPGYYDLSNVSLAKPLELYSPGPTSCPAILSGIDSYGFQPLSDKATIYGSCEPPSCFTLAMTSRIPLIGFWSGSALDGFDPGVYTVMGGDEWGQIDILHFQVNEAIQGVSNIMARNFSLCPSNCGYPSPYFSGYIFLNGSAPLKSLRLFVNGIDEGIRPYSNGSITNFVMLYKGSFQYPEVISGNSYVFRFVATFQDNSTAEATTEVVAG